MDQDGYMVMTGTEHRIDSDEYFINPRWYSSTVLSLINWSFEPYAIKTPFFHSFEADVVGGFVA